MLFVLLALLLPVISFSADLENCAEDSVKFEKIIGLRPARHNRPLLLHKSDGFSPITLDCIKKCKENKDCRSFVLHYNTSHCFWFKNPINGFEEETNILDTSVAWFAKTCLNAGSCDKSWIFDRIPGAILIGNDAKTIPAITRQQCQQYCLDETNFNCRSIKFRITDTHVETIGNCVLSDTDRHLMPNSYRVSTFNEEYFENQCTKASTNAFCAFEEFENATLRHVDEAFDRKTKDACKTMCETTSDYHCRGFSLIKMDYTEEYREGALYQCLIHSEDSKMHGPKLLKDSSGSTYFEKAPCLNISVSCTNDRMNIKFQPQYKFNGKIYMQGYSERLECYAVGKNLNLVQLNIPTMGNHCGISEASSNVNRTLLSGTLILQYNALIQTQSDRIIKVGCIYGNTTKVLVGTGFNVTVAPPVYGTTQVTTNTNLPAVSMRIIDYNTQKEVSDTQIGQELQLIIEMSSKTDIYDMWAGHLVAMTETGDESIILLDEQGCPTNLDVFPPLQKTQTNSTITLQSTFQAFKFSTSPIIRFSIIVQFCTKPCPNVRCENNFTRKKREADLTDLINGTTIKSINRDDFHTTGKNLSELPLEFIIVVRNSKLIPDRLIYGENNKILVAGYDTLKNELCINDSLLIGIIILWVIIQIIMVVSCVVLIRRYKRYYEHLYIQQSTEELYKNFGIGTSNLDVGRRVHFADNHRRNLSAYS